MNIEQFKAELAIHQINLSEKQLQQFEDYYQLLVATNEHVNLTTITEHSAVYLKHFYDSLTPAFFVAEIRDTPIKLCDVGAGAGFPSIPLKIMFPEIEVTIVDSLNKRINFLKELVEKLGLTGVHLVHARAEEFGAAKSDYRESFDLVTARAVARMSVLSELCLPLVKVGGHLVALKATKTQSELEDAQKALKVLGGTIEADYDLKLPITDDERHIVVIEKNKKTPKKFPRKPGTPNKEPIQA
ncbi:16S rRNA (guanine(527)-N(7))-methyltransferase RsmG [Lentilactobacillus senioris]|uniref:16S rRNA (guanine(527)-N(7))-methyltransferase RsmG n=1 Tax=Lentilactobacillus senioris TaxID=931534 RepID=UPI00227F76CB|nr:16S rRNA (guanine(527)-N(7))-methyltransferase RsmG [Lentilactobacillus senioris]MCY9807352.1 16S rRNA (guanine(527)-N(7))-methyltransferase RsmG [Lentilactobacillus senioris]